MKYVLLQHSQAAGYQKVDTMEKLVNWQMILMKGWVAE